MSRDAPGRRDDVSHAPGRVVPAQVGVALRVLVRHAHAELCVFVHLDLPVILPSDGHQVAQNRHTPARHTTVTSCTRPASESERWRRVRPGEGAVAEGHVTERKIFIQVEHGEAVGRQRQTRMCRVLQQVEKRTCHKHTCHTHTHTRHTQRSSAHRLRVTDEPAVETSMGSLLSLGPPMFTALTLMM